MEKTYIVGFDGTDPCNRAVEFAIGCAALQEAKVHLVHVLEWSPYSFLTQEELEERHARRQEEVARAEKAIQPIVDKLAKRGVKVTSEVRYGHSVEILCDVAREQNASQIFVGRRGRSKLAARLIGSVGMSLVQVSPVPVTVVP